MNKQDKNTELEQTLRIAGATLALANDAIIRAAVLVDHALGHRASDRFDATIKALTRLRSRLEDDLYLKLGHIDTKVFYPELDNAKSEAFRAFFDATAKIGATPVVNVRPDHPDAP